MEDYYKNILLLEGVASKVIIGNTKVLIYCKVIDKNNIRSLEISATDVIRNYWELLITYNDFEDHLQKMGIISQDWSQFFRLMYNSITNKDLSVELKRQELSLNLNYQIGVGKLKGSFILHAERNSNQELIANLVFAYIDKLENKGLKRLSQDRIEDRPYKPVHKEIRDLSSDAPQLIAVPTRPKVKVVKKKNPKGIGSKIL